MSPVVQFGQYLLLKKLATGGMAELFLGKQVGLEGFEKPVVIKRILPHLSENDDFITMFLDEARVAARLNHPRVVQIFDLGKEETSYYIAMEYVRGQDLRKILKRAQTLREAVPVGITLQILAGVLEGLDHAHRKTDEAGRPIHLVHRDVSPQNILVSYEGDVKLVDFGIAKASTQIYQTRVGILKGKYAYMSPEQARGLPLDRRSDIFAVGILLFEVTTGRRLFRQTSEVETLKKVIECSVTPPSSFDPQYPRELEEILLKALQRNPADRFQNARDMQLALEAFLQHRGTIVSAARLGEYMQRLFAKEMEINREEMRVLMDARPGSPPPSAFADWEARESAPRSMPPTTPPPLEPKALTPSAPDLPAARGATPAEEDLAVEPTMLLGDSDLMSSAGPADGPVSPTTVSPMRFSQAGDTRVTPPPEGMTHAAANPEPEPEPTPGLLLPTERRHSSALLWITCLALLGAVAAVVWMLMHERGAGAGSAEPTANEAPPIPSAPPAPPPMGLPQPQDGMGSTPTPPDVALAPPDEEPAREEPSRRPRRRAARERRAIAAATPGPATLAVRSVPATQVFFEGRLLGPTPLETRLDPGAGMLRLRNQELGIDYRVGLQLSADARSEVNKVFGRARLKVSVEPWAEVTLDGRSLGETPLPAQSVYEGEHLLTLRNPTLGKRETVQVHIRSGETRLVERHWKE
jgi:serine/threonine-protein kinase